MLRKPRSSVGTKRSHFTLNITVIVSKEPASNRDVKTGVCYFIWTDLHKPIPGCGELFRTLFDIPLQDITTDNFLHFALCQRIFQQRADCGPAHGNHSFCDLLSGQ
jgi:hypothetical protein